MREQDFTVSKLLAYMSCFLSRSSTTYLSHVRETKTNYRDAILSISAAQAANSFIEVDFKFKGMGWGWGERRLSKPRTLLRQTSEPPRRNDKQKLTQVHHRNSITDVFRSRSFVSVEDETFQLSGLRQRCLALARTGNRSLV